MTPGKAANDFANSGLRYIKLLSYFRLACVAIMVEATDFIDISLGKFVVSRSLAACRVAFSGGFFCPCIRIANKQMFGIDAVGILARVQNFDILGNRSLVYFPRNTMNKPRFPAVVNASVSVLIDVCSPKPASICFVDVPPELFLSRFSGKPLHSNLALLAAILVAPLGNSCRFCLELLAALDACSVNRIHPIDFFVHLVMAIRAKEFKAFGVLNDLGARYTPSATFIVRFLAWIFMVKMQCPGALTVSAPLALSTKSRYRSELVFGSKSHDLVPFRWIYSNSIVLHRAQDCNYKESAYKHMERLLTSALRYETTGAQWRVASPIS